MRAHELSEALATSGQGGPFVNTSLSAPFSPQYRALERFQRFYDDSYIASLMRPDWLAKAPTAADLFKSVMRALCDDEHAAFVAAVAARAS